VALLLHRMIAVAWGVGPEAMQAMDLTVLTFIGVAGAAIVPRLLWAAPIGLLGMVASAMFPAAIGTIFPVTGLLVTFALAFLLASARHPPDAN
jgi:hypothetical protein